MKAGKRNKIFQELRCEIQSGLYSVGCKLPGELQLKSRFGVARETLRAALVLLEREHLITRIHGRGTFVRFHGSDRRRILYVAPHLSKAMPESLENNARNAGFELAGCNLESFRSYDLAAMDDFLESHKISGVILHGSSFISNEDVLDNIRDLSIPVVLIFANLSDLLNQHFPGSYCDLPEGWERGLRYLKRIGHRRVGVIAPFLRGYSFQEYQNLLSRIGLDSDSELLPRMSLFAQLNNKNQPFEYTKQIDQEVVRMLSLSKPPSVFYCFNDHWAVPVYKTLNNLKLRIPDDVAVMGFVSGLDCETLTPALSSVEIDYQKVYTHAVGLIDRQQSVPQIMKVELVLHQRGST